MKIAFLHLAFCGNQQNENKEKILQGMKIAAANGAQWVLTPEMALQGYTMIREDFPFQLVSEKNGLLQPFMEAARMYKQRLFLGCGFVKDRTPRNSCAVINPDGSFCVQHNKISIVKWITEQWAHPGEDFSVWNFDGIKTSVMVCADMYYAEHGEIIAGKKAELIVGIAAWTEGGHDGPPQVAWKRMSKAAGNIPLLVVNQTGTKGMDFSAARSAVVDKGQLLFYYEGKEAILFIDYDIIKKKIMSNNFEIYYF